jgi:hypothetical protein
VAAAVNAAAFHASGLLRQQQPGDPVPLRLKLQAAASILLWVGVVICGRMIAYV